MPRPGADPRQWGVPHVGPARLSVLGTAVGSVVVIAFVILLLVLGV